VSTHHIKPNIINQSSITRTRAEQVLNNDHAMVKFEDRFKEMSKALVNIFRNKWRHKHLLYQVFSKVFENPLIKGL
jgi:hypothetical protein